MECSVQKMSIGQTYTFDKMVIKLPGWYEMKGFTPTAESHGFSPIPGTPYLIIDKSQTIWFVFSMARIARAVAPKRGRA